MSEEEESGSELCTICDQWCGTEAAKQIAEWEASIIQKLDELEEFKKYKADKEKMSKEKMTDAELAQLRIEIACDYLESCREIDSNLTVREAHEHLGIGLIVAQIAIWKIFREGRFDICKTKK